MEVDDWIGVAQLPEDGGGETADADDEHPDDEAGAEPVVDLAAVEEDLEGGGAEAYEGDADAVDREFSVFADGLALFGVGVGVVDEAVGEEEEEADGDVDEEDPAPVVVSVIQPEEGPMAGATMARCRAKAESFGGREGIDEMACSTGRGRRRRCPEGRAMSMMPRLGRCRRRTM